MTRQSKWTHWDLNPGPSACEADVIPLHHVPHTDGRATHTLSTGKHFVLPFSACVKLGFSSDSARSKGGANTSAGAAIAQLGERQTEDLKVPGSIPGLGILILL